MPDLFADPETRERAAKLMRLLGSDAAGEADAARTALLRLLARHGAGLDDLAQRLLDPVPREDREDQNDTRALQVTLAAAERRAALAEAASQTALAEAGRLRTVATRMRWVTLAGGGAAALLLALAWLPSGGPAPSDPMPARPAAPPPPPPVVPAPAPAPAPAPLPAMPAPAPAPRQPSVAGRTGKVVAPEGVLLRLDPVPGAPSVAVLTQGTKVAIDQAFPMLGTDWMQVRSPQGAGFVPASTIGPE